jgi:UDP-N-acetylmuramoyl-L-alanyl-D-glutamate--2,6-diaminopimelate ligase
MKLSNLFFDSRISYRPYNFSDVDVSGIAFDSREVSIGDLFVAIKGGEYDGHNFIRDAIKKGAVAVVLQDREFLTGKKVPYLFVEDTRVTLALLSSAFYGHPSRKLHLIGITGTDGKTTTCHAIYSILKSAGYRVGLISSISAIINEKEYETGFHTTTPDSVSLQRYLADMVKANAEYAIIETSSHGLAQHRVDGCEFDVGVLTNITSEHLDYHKSREEYINAKELLFRRLSKSFRKKDVPKISILNADDPSFYRFQKWDADKKISYGLSLSAMFYAYDIHLGTKGIFFKVKYPEGEIGIRTSLLGRYNVYNLLAASAVAYSQGVSPEKIVEGIGSLTQVKGRMEIVPHKAGDFTVIIDFAHTSAGLEKALEAARMLSRNRVIVVFGSAGLRDREKRGKMGYVAGRLSDKIFITAEDPRTEPVDLIIDEIAKGLADAGKEEGKDFWRIPDREEAITKAIDIAEAGDVVIICGKAHEKTMCIGSIEYSWDEYSVVRKALANRCHASYHLLPTN